MQHKCWEAALQSPLTHFQEQQSTCGDRLTGADNMVYQTKARSDLCLVPSAAGHATVVEWAVLGTAAFLIHEKQSWKLFCKASKPLFNDTCYQTIDNIMTRCLFPL